MKRNSFVVIISFLMFVGCQADQTSGESGNNDSQVVIQEDEPSYTSDEDMQRFFDSGLSEQQVMIRAEVIKNLADDNEGSRHQKFIVELESGQTVLISHNIDLADRINNLQEGDEVKIFGQYEWNDRGGVIHWTHHDPDGIHVGGWIEHQDKFYD